MIAKQEIRESFMLAAGLIGQFRLYYHQMQLVASTLGTFAALGNAQQPLLSKNTNKSRQIICLCRVEKRITSSTAHMSTWQSVPLARKHTQI
jgi:hypothetical protein